MSTGEWTRAVRRKFANVIYRNYPEVDLRIYVPGRPGVASAFRAFYVYLTGAPGSYDYEKDPLTDPIVTEKYTESFESFRTEALPETPGNPENPATGDKNTLSPWLPAAALCAAAVPVTILVRRKRTVKE